MSVDAYSVAIQALLKACQDGKPQHELLIPVCDTPACLIAIGFPALPVVISGKIVDKVHFDHGITKGTLERLPQLLAMPKAIYASATVDGGAVVVVTMDLKGTNHVIVPIHPNRAIGRASFNVVASVYDKPAAMEQRWRDGGLLLWEPAPTTRPGP